MRRSCARRLEPVLDDVFGDAPSQVRALVVRIAEVEADEHARLVDVFDDVVQARVAVYGARRAAVEGERDAASTEERLERRDGRRGVTRVR